MENYMHVRFPAVSQNEGLSRMLISAFVSQFDPTLDELTDVKTAVSEAVTNCIIHGYARRPGEVELTAERDGRRVVVTVRDRGEGIANVEKAMEPFYTSKPELERSGMGFTVMETFMDSLRVTSRPGEGTTVRMEKAFAPRPSGDDEP